MYSFEKSTNQDSINKMIKAKTTNVKLTPTGRFQAFTRLRRRVNMTYMTCSLSSVITSIRTVVHGPNELYDRGNDLPF